MEDQANTLQATTVDIIKKAGLTESQARGYLTLIENGALTPAEIADKTGETRTNAYMICDKLEKLGLISKKDVKKATYTPNHPSTLETLAERRRKAVTRNEQEVKQGISPLIDIFYAHTEMPGTRTLQGIEGIKDVYTDTLRTPNNTIYLLRTVADTPDLGINFLNNYRQTRADKGIHTYALTPDSEIARQHMSSGEDQKMLFHRTIIPSQYYTAPVEIDVYGDKVAFIAFGETQMATVITSPPLALAMQQVLALLAQYAKYQATVDTLNDGNLAPGSQS